MEKMNLNQLPDFLNSKSSGLNSKLEKAIKLCCEKVRSDIQYNMSHTPRDSSKNYYTNNKSIPHHPSWPYNPPAPDTGNLRESIRYEVKNESREIYGIVGSTQKDPPYAFYLEYGTSKMIERPWLRPAMRQNSEFIRSVISKSVQGIFSGGSN